MKSYRVLTLLCFTASLLSGCYAGIRAGEVETGTKSVEGLRYFLPAPYLIVEKTAKGQVDASIQYLADRSRVFYVDPIVVLASQKAEIELNPDGTLKSFKLEQDATPVSTAVVEGVRDVAVKKLDLEKTAAEERAKRAASGSERLDDKKAQVWIFALKGSVADLIQSSELSLPPAADGGGGAAPTGKIEGTFSGTVEASKRSAAEPKLTALHRPSTKDVSISHADHKFTEADLQGPVTVEGLPPNAITVVDGNLIVKDSDIPTTGAKVKFRSEEVILAKPKP